MKKSLIFSIALLGLMSGNVECAQGASEINYGLGISNLVVAGWAVWSIAQRDFCGTPSDAFCTVVPMMCCLSNDKPTQGLGTALAVANLGRITYDLLKRPKAKRVSVEVQTDERDLLPVGARAITPEQAREIRAMFQAAGQPARTSAH